MNIIQKSFNVNVFSLLLILTFACAFQTISAQVRKVDPNKVDTTKTTTQKITTTTNVNSGTWSVDSSYNPNVTSNWINFNAIREQPNTSGKLLATVNSSCSAPCTATKIVRLNTNGTIDSTFTSPTNLGKYLGGAVSYQIAGIQWDGKIIIYGDFQYHGTLLMNGSSPNFSSVTPLFYLTRLNANGSLDTTFNPNFYEPIPMSGPPPCNVIPLSTPPKCFVPDFIKHARVDVYGNILLYSESNFHFNGSPQSAGFIKLTPDAMNKIPFANPTLTAAYPNTPSVFAMEINSANQVYIGGSFEKVNGINRLRIARLDALGNLDNSFNSSNGVGGSSVLFVHKLKVLGNRVFINGNFTTYGGTSRINFAVIKDDGTLDATFTNKFDVQSLSMTSGNKYLTSSSNGVDRLNADGSFDVTLIGGFNDELLITHTLPDGRILLGGAFTQINTIPRNQIAIIKWLGSGSYNPN